MNFLNSPPGPLGSAGQSSNSTQPSSIFNNANSPFTRAGQGLQALRDKIGNFGGGGDIREILSSLLGSDGGILGGLKQIPNGIGQAVSGAASLFTGGPGSNPTGTPPQAPGQAGAASNGILSRFMQGNQNG
jgi:hypothetical protein